MSRSGVFICPSCQAVVRSEKSPEEGLVCGECHHEFGKPVEVVPDPGTPAAPARLAPAPRPASVPKGKSKSIVRDLTAKRAPVVKTPTLGEETQAAFPSANTTSEVGQSSGTSESRDEEIIMPDGTRKIRRRKKRPVKEKNKPLMLFLLGWLTVVVIIFALFKVGKGSSEADDKDAELDISATRNRIFFTTHRQAISANFVEFMRAQNEEDRVLFIDRSADLALSFARYYRSHSFPQVELPMGIIASNIIEISKDPVVLAIESIWQDSAKHLMGTVHVYDGRAWKLDWECFAPYSTDAWTRFNSGGGALEGDFRLLVRKRRSNDESEFISLSFYRAPEIADEENEFRKTESPDVRVRINSPEGKKFLELWDQFEKKEYPLDSLLPKIDPSGFMRINVKLAWEDSDQEGEKKMVLKEILGLAWFGQTIQEAQLSVEEKEKDLPINLEELSQPNSIKIDE